jgi:hypothetical protein
VLEIFVGSLLVGVLGLLVLGWRRSAPDTGKVRATAAALLDEAGLDPADPDLVTEAAGRLARRRRYDLLGRVLGVVVGTVADHAGIGGFVLGLLGGAALGRFAGQVVEVRRSVAGGARVTHLLRPGLADYARPASVLLVHVVALTPVAMAAVWFGHEPPARVDVYHPATDGIVLGLAGSSLGALAVAWAAALVVLSLRRVAGSPAALALDDAFRLSTLRDLAVLPLAAGPSSALLLGGALHHLSGTGWLGSPGPSVLCAVLALAAIVIDLVGRPRWQRLHAAA